MEGSRPWWSCQVAELQTLAVDDPLEAVIEALDSDGGVIVRDMLGTGAAEQIVAELAGTYGESTPGSKSGIELWEGFHGRNTVRFCGLAAKSRAFVDHALLNPLFLSLADHYLLARASAYWLNTSQVMVVGPGEPAQYIHRDQNNWPEALGPEGELTISCMFALSDFTKENGATVVIPGSHINVDDGVQRGMDPPPESIAYAEMPAGSGMIYSGRVSHGAGHNATDTWRYGMHVSFVLGWLRPEEASTLVVDYERAVELPERARQLLGWSSYHSTGGGRTWLVDFEDASSLFS